MRGPTHFSRARGRWFALAWLVLTVLIVPGGGAFAAFAGQPPYPTPSITKFTPTSGAPGTKVTIIGKYFVGDRTVAAIWFGGTNAKFVDKSPTKLIATVPKGAKSGKISAHFPAVEETDTTVAAPAQVVRSKASFTVT